MIIRTLCNLAYFMKLLMLLLVLIVSCKFRTLVYPEFWHIQVQKHIQNPGIFTILIYSQPWYPGISKTLSYSKPEAYPEHCQSSTRKRFVKVVNYYNYFRQLFSQYKLASFFTSRNKYHKVVTPDVVVLSTCWYIEINSPGFVEAVLPKSINQSINVFQGKIQTVQLTNIYKHIPFLHDKLMIIVIMKTNELLE